MDPFNLKLHTFLMKKGYRHTTSVRYDRYDHLKRGITIFYYANGYIMILDSDGEPAKKEITKEIEKVL